MRLFHWQAWDNSKSHHFPVPVGPELLHLLQSFTKFHCFFIPLIKLLSSAAVHSGSAQACSLSALHSCSFTSEGSVLNRSSSTTRLLFFNSRHSPSSTGRHSRRFPRSSSWVSPVSSPKRDGRVCKQLFPRFRVRSFLHWNSSGGNVSIWNGEERRRLQLP